jgi:outer membrane protease
MDKGKGKKPGRSGAKIIWLFVFSAAIAFGAAAGEHSFSVGGSFGLLSGQAEEIVYVNEVSSTMVSQLLWDLKPLVYFGVDLNYTWQRPANKWGVFANGLFKIGLPSNTGKMEDRDWMEEIAPDVYVSTYPWLRYYSVHDNKTEGAVLMDFDLGASFSIAGNFWLRAYVSYSFMYFLWTASGGSVLYPNGHVYLPSIDVITYEQIWHVVSPAAALYGEFNSFFDIEVSLKATPFVWCTDEDNHILRDLVINDYMFGGFFFEPSLLFSFKPAQYFVLSFSLKYRNISGPRGDGVYKETGELPFTAKNMGGAGYRVFDTGLIAKFRM